MRVLMTADTVGGVWTYALDLTRALAPHGVHVVLATMGAPLSPAQWQAAQRLPNLYVCESLFRLEWMDDAWNDVAQAGDWLLDLERQVCPDVVHLNGYVHAALPWRAPALVVAHSCVLSWWRAVNGEDPPPHWEYYRYQVARGLQSASLVVAPTQAMLDALGACYGPPAVTRVIPNGRDPALFAPAPKEPFVLSAGRLWDDAKNLATLDRAATWLPWPVYVAGNTYHPCGTVAQAQGAHLLGQVSPEDLAGWFARAAIYALPARYEPFGLSALEAALSGCALVLGDIPSLREVWGDAAVFVAPDDADALRSALCSLMADPDRRAALSALALARARRFTPERMAQGYLDAYRELTLAPSPLSR